MKTGYFLRNFSDLPPMVYEIVGYHREFRALEKECDIQLEEDSETFFKSLAGILKLPDGMGKLTYRIGVIDRGGYWFRLSPMEAIIQIRSENVQT